MLFDVTHPSHAMLFGAIGHELERRGWRSSFASRRKDATIALFDVTGTPHFVASGPSQAGLLGLAVELLVRTTTLMHFMRRNEVDVVVSRSPAGCIAGRLTNAVSIFDTDDGSGAGIHHRLAVPFADYVTSPEALSENYGPRHRRYRSLKSLAYLHPSRYRPDHGVREAIGLEPDRPLFVLRRSAYSASHDGGRSGIDEALASALVERLSRVGHLVISSEDPADGPLSTSEILRRHPERLRDILSASALVVTDGASVAEEAAVLGTFAVFVSDFAGERDYLERLEHKYGAIRSFRPSQRKEIMELIGSSLAELDATKSDAESNARRIIEEHVDLVPWYADFLADALSDAR